MTPPDYSDLLRRLRETSWYRVRSVEVEDDYNGDTYTSSVRERDDSPVDAATIIEAQDKTVAELREQLKDALERESNLIDNIANNGERKRLEADNAALRQLLASIPQRIVNPLYDDPTERKGLATVIDAALLAGREA